MNFAPALGRALLLVLTALPLLLSPPPAPAAESPKRVLIFSSEDQQSPGITLVSQSVRSTLKSGLSIHVQFFYEDQDSFRISTEKYEGELVRLLQRKYDGERFDLIYPIGRPALRFLLKHRSELFTDTPVIYTVVDQGRVAGLDLGSNVTGVGGKVELAPTLDIALALQPEAQGVVVVAGTASVDTALVEMARQEFRPYEGKVEFTYLIGLPIEELRTRLASLPEKSIVFYLSVNSDSVARIYTNPEVLALLAPSSSAPIYGALQHYIGNGAVGGRVINFEEIGTRAAEMGLRILAGERPQDIAPQTVPSAAMFDWRELRRWGISEQSLPPGSIVRFKELTVWEQYKWHIVGVISLCIFEALLIAWLLFTRARRRKAERESVRFARLAEAEHRRLDDVVSNTPGVVWESRIEPGGTTRKIEFVNDYVEKMLGYSVEECLAKPNFWQSILLEEDREESARAVEAILAGGREGVHQFRCRTKDGRILWVEAHLAAIRDEAGTSVGLRGVAMDITERKRAEEARRLSEERLTQAINVARFGVFEHDHLTGVLHCSPLTREIHGWSQEESSLERIIAQLYLEDREPFITAIRRAHDPAGDGYFSHEFRIVLRGGEVRWLSARAQTFFEGEGVARRPVRTIGAEVDITERKQAEEDLRKALEEVNQLKNQLQAENIYLQEEIKLVHNFDEIVGRSDAIKYVLFKIEQVAPTNSTVLILGETGTGKELVARAIHSASPRKDRPLVKVNCAALSASLIESELFGHDRGAFTGASSRKVGRFELADGATIFLDEIGELPLELQGKLLRVIQEGEFERLGSSKTIKADVRIIAATNRNLQTEVREGRFREDLWYRLNVFPITVPPLKQRTEDIPLLVEHYVKGLSKKLGREITSVSSATMRTLRNHSWPGNVRELANVVERAVINARGPVLSVADSFEAPPAEEPRVSGKSLEEVERHHILSTLDETGWRIEGPGGAAKILGLNPSTLRTRMAKLGIQKQSKSMVET